MIINMSNKQEGLSRTTGIIFINNRVLKRLLVVFISAPTNITGNTDGHQLFSRSNFSLQSIL